MTEHVPDATGSLSLTPPGRGVWQLDLSHYARPFTRFIRDDMVAAFTDGQARWVADYGVPLKTIRGAHTEGFFYVAPEPLAGPPGGPPPPRWLFWLLARLVPAFRRCARTAAASVESRRWRADAQRWSQETLPALIARFCALGETPLSPLDDAALLAHLDAALDAHNASVSAHLATNGTVMVPLGLLLWSLRAWGVSAGPAEVVAAVGGASPERARDEALRAALMAALPPDALEGPPAEVVERLRAEPGPLGEHARAWLGRIEHRQVWAGDLYLPTHAELPHLLVEQLRRPPPPAHEPLDLSDRIPEAHRAEYEALRAEAALTAWVRDERSAINDAWAGGVLRRALLAVGHRLAARGLLETAADAVHLRRDELEAALLQGDGPDVATVRQHAADQARPLHLAPAWLGGEPSELPDFDVLPAPLDRVLQGIMLYGAAMEEDGAESQAPLSGIAASPGAWVGIARVVHSAADMVRVAPGDVLVTRATMPSHTGVLGIAGAVVTDRGGALSHAAIVARELGIPAVVGTRSGTRDIPDGARVRVDGTAGRVELL
jgi:rifampicin phosphotransferase